MESAALTKKQEAELEVAEMRLLRFSLWVTRTDKIRNEFVRGSAHVARFSNKVREVELRWFDHMQRREEENIGRRMLMMESPGRRGRPKRRYMDVIQEAKRVAGMKEEDMEDRVIWIWIIRCGSS